MSFETDLQERLAAVAGRVTAGDDEAAADAVITRRRDERRHRALAAAVAVCLAVAIAVLVPVLGTAGDRSAPADPTPSAPTSTAAPWDEPVRGSLAGDADFLAAARALDVPDLRATAFAPLETHRVVFAGDERGTRWVLVSGVVEGQLVGRWYTGPEGAAVAELSMGGTEMGLEAHRPIGYQVTTDAGSTVLVVGDPGDTVESSAAVEVASDGTVHRRWTAASAEDGSVVVESGPERTGTGIQYRVLRDGAVVATGPTASSDESTPVGPDPVDLAARTPRRPSAAPVSEEAVAQAMRAVLDPTGLHASDVALEILWAGTIPAPGGSSTRVVVLATTLPSGAVVTTTAHDGSAAARNGFDPGSCGSTVHPAGTSLDDVVAAALCTVETVEGGSTSSLVVSGPGSADAATLTAADGTVLAEQALLDGAAVVIDAGRTTSVTVTAGATVPVSRPSPRDVFDLDGG